MGAEPGRHVERVNSCLGEGSVLFGQLLPHPLRRLGQDHERPEELDAILAGSAPFTGRPSRPCQVIALVNPPPGKDAHARTWTSFCLSLAPLISEKVTSGGHAEPVRVPIESLSFEEKKLSG